MQLKGGWNAPSNFHQFKSAVQLLHKLNRQEGPYKHVCIDCMHENHLMIEHGRGAPHYYGSGCPIHHPRPEKYPYGNPLTDQSFLNEASVFNKKAAKHAPKINTQLCPHEVRNMFSDLSPSFDSFDFMTYTMVILAITLGLRHDEFASIRMEDFDCNMFIVFEDFIECIVLSVEGKRGKMVPLKYTLLIWFLIFVHVVCFLYGFGSLSSRLTVIFFLLKRSFERNLVTKMRRGDLSKWTRHTLLFSTASEIKC